MKHIHVQCLKEWLLSRRSTKENSACKTYCWKSLDCELCRVSFPDNVYFGGKRINVVDYDTPETKFVALETISSNQARVLHVVNLEAKNVFRMGRGNDSDVRISDISVSRTHALLRSNERGECFLEDANSKFGTLLLLKTPLKLTTEPVSLQAGRTMLVL